MEQLQCKVLFKTIGPSEYTESTRITITEEDERQLKQQHAMNANSITKEWCNFFSPPSRPAPNC